MYLTQIIVRLSGPTEENALLPRPSEKISVFERSTQTERYLHIDIRDGVAEIVGPLQQYGQVCVRVIDAAEAGKELFRIPIKKIVSFQTWV